MPGAIEGAAVGFSLSASIMCYLGLAFLFAAVGKNLGEVTGVSFKAGTEVNIKAGTNVTIEAGVMLTLKAGSSTIVLGPAGVSIVGTMVNVNSGGGGSGANPVAPAAPATPEEPTAPEDPLAS